MSRQTRSTQDVEYDSNDGPEHDNDLDESDDEANPLHGNQIPAGHGGIISYTAFDAYFVNASAPSRTSTNVFSHLVPPLTPEEYSRAIHSASSQVKHLHPGTWSDGRRAVHFTRFAQEVDEGFNLLFYGFGSKRVVLNQFAIECCSKKGHTVVANGFQPEFTLKDLIHSVEKVPGVAAMPLLSPGVDGQTRRIYDFFAWSATKHHLYIVVHNIDAPALRTSRARSCLSLLALNPHIHIIASVDHINAPLLWSTTDASTRTPDSTTTRHSSPPRGFTWIWHDLTTMASYDLELSYADRSSISGISAVHSAAARRQRESGGVAQNGSTMTDTAALHILASVTQKAKKLFALMGAQQLGRMEGAAESADDARQNGIGYDVLFIAARDNFIATNDTSLRSLLSEFKDHGLVIGIQGGSGGESLWIPLRKERLASILGFLNTDRV
jgi:origin recognition complex subunit 2